VICFDLASKMGLLQSLRVLENGVRAKRVWDPCRCKRRYHPCSLII